MENANQHHFATLTIKKVHKVREIEVPLTNNKRVNFFNYTLDKEMNYINIFTLL